LDTGAGSTKPFLKNRGRRGHEVVGVAAGEAAVDALTLLQIGVGHLDLACVRRAQASA